MHRRTYERLCNEAEKAGFPYQDRLLKGLPGLLARLGVLPHTESEGPDEEQLMKGLRPLRGRSYSSKPDGFRGAEGPRTVGHRGRLAGGARRGPPERRYA
jgi:hypothetical protein